MAPVITAIAPVITADQPFRRRPRRFRCRRGTRTRSLAAGPAFFLAPFFPAGVPFFAAVFRRFGFARGTGSLVATSGAG